jgi:hypothetical protein
MRHALIIDGRRLPAASTLREPGYTVERVGDGAPADQVAGSSEVVETVAER